MTAKPPPPGFEVPVGEMLIIRTNPFGEEALANDAQGDFRERLAIALKDGHSPPNDYEVSVYALQRQEHHTTSQELYTELMGYALPNLPGARKVALVTESELNAAEFYLNLSQPPQNHYNIVIGTDPESLRADELAEVFKIHERIKL